MLVSKSEMRSICDTLKRHRGKLFIAGMSVGAIYAIRQISKMCELTLAESAGTRGLESLELQTRQKYVYETYHHSCVSSLKHIIPLLKKRLDVVFNVDKLIDQLRLANLTDEARLTLWKEIKVLAFARVIAFAYSISVLTLSLKCQVSILASQIFSGFQQTTEKSWWSCLIFFQTFNKREQSTCYFSTSAQNIFFRSIEYFLNTGVLYLFERIRKVCEAELQNVLLTARVDEKGLNQLLHGIGKKLGVQNKEISSFIVPKFHCQDLRANYSELSSLLLQLSEALETNDFNQVLTAVVDYYLQNVVKSFVERATGPDLPIAKILPLIADSFYVLLRTDNDSAFQKSLCSNELHQFSLDVFSSKVGQIRS